MNKDIPILLEGKRVGTAVWVDNTRWIATEDGTDQEPFQRDFSLGGVNWLGFNVGDYINHRVTAGSLPASIELTDGMTIAARSEHTAEPPLKVVMADPALTYVDPSGDVHVVEVQSVSSTGGAKGVKPQRYSLIPRQALDTIGEIYDFGTRKYSPHNWRKGYEWSKSYDALQRHLTAWWDREENDKESGLSHLGHAGFHVFALIVFSKDKRYSEFDDRYSKE